MTITNTFYKKIYFIDGPEELSDKEWDNLLMSGKKNWGKYFTPFKTKTEHEEIKNVELLEFETEDEMFEYIKILKSTSLLNYSLEHEKPCLLKLI
jgi:hypothetical protein